MYMFPRPLSLYYERVDSYTITIVNYSGSAFNWKSKCYGKMVILLE